MISGAQRAALAAILLVGAALRMFHLGAESVWMDEAYSIRLAGDSIGRILDERWTDIHPPLYYLLLHAWMPLVGQSEFAVRLLSTLFDLGTIVAAWWVTARLLGPSVALVTALLLTLSPFHVEYAQEARMYALLCLLSTISMGAFLTFFERDRAPARGLYVLATVLMLYTHIYSVFLVAAEAAILALVWRGDRPAGRRAWRPLARASALIALLYVPWIISLVDQVTRVQSAFWIARPLWIAVLHPLFVYAGSVPLVLVLVPLAIGGVLALRREGASDRPVRPALVIIPWLLAPIVLPFVLSKIGAPIFLPKYTIAASVPFAMLVACGAVRVRQVGLRAAVAILLLGLSVARFDAYYGTLRKDGWRQAAASLEAQARPNDVVLFYPWFNQIPFDYYRRREDLQLRPLVPDITTPLPALEALPSLAADAATAGDRVWLVVLQGTHGRLVVSAELGRHVNLVQHTTAQHVDLFLFERRR